MIVDRSIIYHRINRGETGKKVVMDRQDETWQQMAAAGELAGHPLIMLTETDSTNDQAMARGKDGEVAGTVIIAEKQKAGKGRLGRSWYSPAGGGLYFSLILRPRLALDQLSLITLASGLALCRGVRRLCRVDAMLKWPNDLLVKGGKCGGILVESDLGYKPPLVVVGIGLNLMIAPADFPRTLQERASSLAGHCSADIHRCRLLEVILEEIDLVMARLEAGDRNQVLDDWRQYDATLGRRLAWRTAAGKVVEGVALGPDDDGRLKVRDDNGAIHEVISGDIRLQSP